MAALTKEKVWPNLFIVGAPKAGTSSLYAYLRQHPQVYLSPVKEPRFFSHIPPDDKRRYVFQTVTDEESYLDLFKEADGEPVVGEASTTYLWEVATPYRIHARVPEARIIILLRDPIERAHSHYLMNVREGTQTRPFYEALLEDQSRPQGWTTSNLYVGLGQYAPQVERYLELFGPEQVQILLSEDLQGDPAAVVRQTARFLKVDEESIGAMEFGSSYNAYALPRSGFAQTVVKYPWIRNLARWIVPQKVRWEMRDRILFKRAEKPAMDEQAVRLLREVFANDVEKLEAVLGRPLPELRRSWGT